MIEFNRPRRVVSLLALLVIVGCDDDIDPVFQVEGTGSLEGLVFLDADRSGTFDPSAGDRPLQNVRVRLVERGTTSTIANGQATTNTSGRFSLSNLPVGSHDLAIDTVGVGAGVAFCQNPIPVTIFVNEPQFAEVGARGGCVVTILVGEARPVGSPITVRATVVSSPGQIASGRMYVQDATGGIRVDGANTGGVAVAVGDVVEIAGVLSEANRELLISTGRVVDRTTGAVPPPQAITTKAIADAGLDSRDPLQGKLAVIRRARVTSAWLTGGGRNAVVNDGSGAGVVRIDQGVVFTADPADLVPRLLQIMGADKCYDVTGIVATFGTLGELFPRTLNDIREVPCN